MEKLGGLPLMKEYLTALGCGVISKAEYDKHLVQHTQQRKEHRIKIREYAKELV